MLPVESCRPALLLALGLAACSGAGSAPPAEPSSSPTAKPDPADTQPAPAQVDPVAIVAADDRDPADRESDARRKPAELLEFMRLAPGMKVADIGAGFGYTTELLARAVGPTGTVYSQNPTFVLDKFAREGWDARLAKPVNANVVGLEREFGDPFPADIEPLDRVVNVLFYHDFGWMKIDRAAHDADVFAALRPGGTYVIVDSSAAAGHGIADSESLHRVEEALVITELEAAGFTLTSRADFLRDPSDTRDWNALPWRSPERAEAGEFSDKFVLEFTKPGA
ncbi:class I SAM-dependent methyltransferase [Enhygromyxa salina]|uniref:Protein-L-isoaspartate O-methyltransferase n=1 Tax=Enhygromyxa salina TaxID=215803 RepID=A0A2S9YYJ5_9BACT|nr:class I SAM-dependent methyltransferase [Enhygromyxa salina]PRQ10175.1 Protein-L-isoaspartate O-methyltransferase [Enhygromyxa salina]